MGTRNLCNRRLDKIRDNQQRHPSAEEVSTFILLEHTSCTQEVLSVFVTVNIVFNFE